MPAGTFQRELSRETGRTVARAVYRRCLVTGRAMDVFLRRYRRRGPQMAAAFPGRETRTGHLRRHAGRRYKFRSRRALVRNLDRHEPEHIVGPRLPRRPADYFRRLQFLAIHFSRWQEALLLGAHRWTTELYKGGLVGHGPGHRAAPAP